MPRTPKDNPPEDSPRARPGGQSAGSAPSTIAERERPGRAARNRSIEGSRPANDAQPPITAPAAATPQAAAAPTHDDIARRAYQLYLQRGSADGQEVDDWLRAEQDLREGRGRRDDGI
jgi:DUF2934 family protein